MTTRTTLLTAACMLALAGSAAAEGVIAGQLTEVRRITRPLIGPSQQITLTDGRTFKATQQETSVLVATGLLLPEAIVAMPDAQLIRPRRGAPSVGAAIIAASVPRGVKPVPVVVIEKNRGVDARVTSSVFMAEPVALGSLQPGSAVAIVGGAPVVREEGYYVRGTQSAVPRLLSLQLTNGQWVTIEDRIEKMPGVIEGGVAFDPAALQPGRYVRVVRRDDGTYFLGTASKPRPHFTAAPAGKVGSVDARAQVIELSDGSLVYPERGASAVLRVVDQPVDPATLRSGTWVVIDPSPALALEAPSAIPADTMAAGRLLRVR